MKFGQNSSKLAGSISSKKGWKSALIITDSGVKKAGLLNGVTASLEENGVKYAVFDEVQPNPTDHVVEKAASLLKKKKYDVAISIGGGSSIDTGKIASVLATNPGGIKDFELRTFEDFQLEKIKNHPLPLIAIPTTAGTGSEADFWAVATDSKLKYKMEFGQAPSYPGQPYCGPAISLLDPLLTLSLPPGQTVSTGIDAFYHAYETFTANDTTPICQPFSLESMNLVAQALHKAYSFGSDIEAREKMMLAAHFGGVALNLANLTVLHALAHGLAMYEGIPHGVATNVFAPHVMEYNRIATEEKLVTIAGILGTDLTDLPLREASKECIEVFKDFISDLRMPSSLEELNVKESDLNRIAKTAAESMEITGNPRSIDYKGALEIAKKAFKST